MNTFIITARSSHGTIEFDSQTGFVTSVFLDNCPDCPNVGTFDIEEYKKYYNVKELPAFIDILDLGYWSEGESYEPPAEDWRIWANMYQQDGEFIISPNQYSKAFGERESEENN